MDANVATEAVRGEAGAEGPGRPGGCDHGDAGAGARAAGQLRQAAERREVALRHEREQDDVRAAFGGRHGEARASGPGRGRLGDRRLCLALSSVSIKGRARLLLGRSTYLASDSKTMIIHVHVLPLHYSFYGLKKERVGQPMLELNVIPIARAKMFRWATLLCSGLQC